MLKITFPTVTRMLMSKFSKASLFIAIVNKGVKLKYIKLLSISLLIPIPV